VPQTGKVCPLQVCLLIGAKLVLYSDEWRREMVPRLALALPRNLGGEAIKEAVP
jgi:hypothetical protein